MPEVPKLDDVAVCMQNGDSEKALEVLKDRIRHDSGNAQLRLSLAQLECINGNWDKAISAADTASTLDSDRALLCQQWKLQIQAEITRGEVFAGKKTAIVMGEPEAWMAGMQDALRMDSEGQSEAADKARRHAMENAPARSGKINGAAFEWLCDADERVGPAFEAVINGRYTWIPQSVVNSLHVKNPVEMIDLVWSEAVIRLKNGGETTAFIPARYPGSESSDDGKIRLGRLTTFETTPGGTSTGLGQRLFATNADDYPLMQCSDIEFDD